jgi:hypothetical protein
MVEQVQMIKIRMVQMGKIVPLLELQPWAAAVEAPAVGVPKQAVREAEEAVAAPIVLGEMEHNPIPQMGVLVLMGAMDDGWEISPVPVMAEGAEGLPLLAEMVLQELPEHSAVQVPVEQLNSEVLLKRSPWVEMVPRAMGSPIPQYLPELREAVEMVQMTQVAVVFRAQQES